MAKRKKKTKKPLKKIYCLLFTIYCLLFLLLPGQGYYQTLILHRLPPVWREFPFQLPESALYPEKIIPQNAPSLTARSVLVMDIDSSVILYEKNSAWRLLPASTTKIMTAVISLENYRLNDALTVGDIKKEGRVMNLLRREKITVENLLFGLLVHSANDAAEVLAANFPGGRAKFIQEMNRKSHELNLSGTSFVNPSGFDQPGQYTTVLDLARLSSYALKNDIFQKMVDIQKITVYDISGKTKHVLDNVNWLLGKVWGVHGIKTGWTEEAGECLVALTERNNHRILTVILGSEDRFSETEKLIEWAFKTHQWE